MPRNPTYKGCEGTLQGEPETTAQGIERGHKQMEKHSMLMDRKNQYREIGHTAQSNLQIQCYPHQTTIIPTIKSVASDVCESATYLKVCIAHDIESYMCLM